MYKSVSTPSEILVKYLNFSNWNALLTYYIFIILLCSITLYWLLKKNKLWLKITGIILIISLFSIAFWLNPIYENDWKIEGKIENTNLNLEIFKNYSTPILVFADPNCTHCEELIRRLFLMKNQYKTKNVSIVFNNLNEEELKIFQNKLGDIFEINTINEEEFLNITKGRFPMILLKNIENNVTKWHNNNLGLKTLDYLINQSNTFTIHNH